MWFSIPQSACSEALRERQKCDEDGREEIAHLIYGEVPLLALAHILDKCDEYAPHDRRAGACGHCGREWRKGEAGAPTVSPTPKLTDCSNIRDVLAQLT